MALQTIPSRNIDPVESSVISIGFMRGGSAYNVIPDELHIGGTVRSFRPEVRDLLERRMGEVARGVATMHGATAEFSYRRGYPPTINHADEAAFAADVAAEICGEGHVDSKVAPSLGGEDFSYMLQAVPGAMAWIGNGPDEGGCLLHSARYDFNDSAIRTPAARPPRAGAPVRAARRRRAVGRRLVRPPRRDARPGGADERHRDGHEPHRDRHLRPPGTGAPPGRAGAPRHRSARADRRAA